MSAWKAGRCSLACYSSLSCPGEPSYPLTPPALFVTACQGEEQGPGGRDWAYPLTGKGHRRGLVGPLRDDREVRGPLWCAGVEPVEPPPKQSSACYPTQRKGRGSPSANWYYQGVHHLGAKHREVHPYTHSRGTYEHVFLCICTCTTNQTHPLRKAHTHIHTCSARMYPRTPLSSASVQCWALQPWGEAPASSPARAGQAEHLAPRKGHPHTQPPTPTVLLGVKEASPTPSFPLSLPGIAPRHPCARLDIPHSLSHSQSKCYIWKRLLPAASCLIYSGMLKGISFR